jgi:hypothetical protein
MVRIFHFMVRRKSKSCTLIILDLFSLVAKVGTILNQNGGDFLFGRCRQKAVHIWEDTDEYGWPDYN